MAEGGNGGGNGGNSGGNGGAKQKILTSFLAIALALLAAVLALVNRAAPEIMEEQVETWGWLEPEESLVGQVKQGGTGVRGIAVYLVDNYRATELTSRTSDNDGYYRIGGVQEGDYSIIARRDLQTLGLRSVIVRDGEKDKLVEPIDIAAEEAVVSEPPQTDTTELPPAPNVALAVDQSVVQAPVDKPQEQVELRYTSELTKEAPTGATTFYHVTVWLEGPAVDDSIVESVTYYLHPTFEPSVVSRRPEDDFVLEFDTWGEFTLTARVYFTDGTFQDVEVEIQHG